MPLDPKAIDKPLKKLSKLLKKLPKLPSPDQVHDVRTRARRTEATLHALLLDQHRNGQRTLESITPVRKRAGKVRDMDVLTGFASTLSGTRDHQCLVQLLEHLGHRRFRSARKLRKTAAKQRASATQSLQRCSSSIMRDFKNKNNHLPADAAAVALELSVELAAWPKLNANNLHPFRLKVKELRNVLQLSGEDGELLQMLGEVKDKVGEWHDWTELAAIADDVLRHPGRCEVRQQIRSGVKQRFAEAMEVCTQLRSRYFQPSGGKNKGAAGARKLKAPVLQATGRLAA